MAAKCVIDPQTSGQIRGKCFSDRSNKVALTGQLRELVAKKTSLQRFDKQIVSRLVAALTLSGLMSSCAHIWTDEHGVQHITGLVHLQIPTASAQWVSADAIQMTSVGLTFVQSRWINEFVFGYSDSTLMQIGPDSCVRVSKLSEMFPVLNSEWEGKVYAH